MNAALLFVAFALFCVAGSARGAYFPAAVYTFEEPNFYEYESTPLLDQAPNYSTYGAGSFRVDFTTEFDSYISEFEFLFDDPSASGLNLLVDWDRSLDNHEGEDSVLTMTFSGPFEWAQFAYATDATATSLWVTSGDGDVIWEETPQYLGESFYGGWGGLFHFRGGYSTLVFNVTGSWFAIDNLSFVFPSVSAVPEPAMLALLGIGLAGLGFSRRKRSTR